MTDNSHTPFPWQHEQWHYLQKRLQSQHLPHALLFSGMSGIGKLEFAYAFMQSLLCQQRDQDGYACGCCESCHWCLAGSHPDLLLVQPEEKSTTIKVDAIRSLIDRLTQSAHQGGYKIALISPAEAMPTAAMNALLKILEEPTPRTVLILISQQPKILAATLRSRCQTILFPTPNRTLSETWLSKQLNINAQETTVLLDLADGAPLNAITLQKDVQLHEQQHMLLQLEQIISKNLSPLEVANAWAEKPLMDILNCWQIWLADLIRYQLGIKRNSMANTVESVTINKINQQVNTMALYYFYDKTNQLRQQLLTKYNPNALLALEELLCSWAKLKDKRC